ncbi:hypothetical protein PsorP6_004811 [Peronosclerospora sorghi]|uniref:Uncharacterized protein n=1 Tax=Peronosclerospora sorghi TaxID=230839 RepID=A0ACC0VMU2_9STRA|nr:hypothetical protein PsorP6_004811 [Peronosclerospora sorghi]
MTSQEDVMKPETVVEQEETLAHLFGQHRLQDAMETMRVWDSGRLTMEISLAFDSVPHAPSSVLHCVNLYCQLPGKQITYISNWIETAVACIRASSNSMVSSDDSQVAASMLPALKRSRMAFVANFALAYRIDAESLTDFCLDLTQTRVGLAVYFMKELKKEDLVPTDVILDHVIKQKDFQAGDRFVKGHKGKQQQYVQKLIDCNVENKVIKKRILLYKLKASAFPVYFQRQQQSVIRYFLYSKEYDQALQFTENSETLKLYACKMLIRDNGSEDPATKQFIYRAGMSEQFPEVDTTAEDSKSFECQDELTPLGPCVSLTDVIGDTNIFFVDTASALQDCTDYLLKYPVIGFDSEWKAVHISSGSDESPAKCALLQLASLNKAFVVDVIALYNHANILAPLFQSESVIKLGFDTRGDVKALRPFLTGGFASDNVISMLVDLQAVTRKLSNFQAPSVSSLDKDGNNADDKVQVSTAEPSPNSSTPYNDAFNTKTPRRRRKNARSNNSKKYDTSTKPTPSSLVAVAEKYLGLSLDKRMRMSDWEHRPLTQAQLYYAALDAHFESDEDDAVSVSASHVSDVNLDYDGSQEYSADDSTEEGEMQMDGSDKHIEETPEDEGAPMAHKPWHFQDEIEPSVHLDC